MEKFHVKVVQGEKTGIIAREKFTNKIRVIKQEDWSYRRDYCDKHFTHSFTVEDGSALILEAKEAFAGYKEFTLSLIPQTRDAVPYRELQERYAKATGGNSMAEVQWLAHYKEQGMSDDDALQATKLRFYPPPHYATKHNDRDLTGMTFPVVGNPPYVWTVVAYYRGGSWTCRESQHNTTCCFYDVDILATQKPKKSRKARIIRDR